MKASPQPLVSPPPPTPASFNPRDDRAQPPKIRGGSSTVSGAFSFSNASDLSREPSTITIEFFFIP